jgi:hypothetical protein
MPRERAVLPRSNSARAGSGRRSRLELGSVRREHVSSSAITAVGYDPESETLEVEFRSGAVYEYRHVPSKVYRSLMSAPSKGQYLSRHIRDRYGFSREE